MELLANNPNIIFVMCCGGWIGSVVLAFFMGRWTIRNRVIIQKRDQV